MTSPGHILIIDDDPTFVTTYRQIFEKQGLLVTAAHTAEDAIEKLEALGSQLDVILLDQKLQGRGGPDSGLDLISRAESLAPFAKTIVVTGYATDETIERAFQLGIYDYLEKKGAFTALIRAKVRNAIEVTSERRLAALSRERVVSELRSTWAAVRTETDRNRKGPDGVGQGVVAWDVEVTNQAGELVASYDILTLVAKKATKAEAAR